MTTLVLDNIYNKTHLPPLLKHAGEDFKVFDAAGGKFPPSLKGFDRMLISGSEETILADLGWIDAEMDLVRSAVKRNMPILGICFGHQLIARALWGKKAVARNPAPEMGFDQITLVGEDNGLFAGVPRKFRAFNSHFDRVVKVNDEMEVLGRSEGCDIHAMHVKGLPVYGVQFHPEVSRNEGKAMFRDSIPKYPPLKGQLEAGIKNAVECEATKRIFENFHNI